MWLLICYSLDAYRVSTVPARPYAFSPRGKTIQKVWYGFRHSHEWCGAGGKWVNLLMCVLAGVWGLGREQCVGVTQESCSTTVAGILKRPSPALHDIYMCPTRSLHSNQLLLGVATNQHVRHSTVLSLWTLVIQIKYKVNETHVGNAPWTANRSQS